MSLITWVVQISYEKILLQYYVTSFCNVRLCRECVGIRNDQLMIVLYAITFKMLYPYTLLLTSITETLVINFTRNSNSPGQNTSHMSTMALSQKAMLVFHNWKYTRLGCSFRWASERMSGASFIQGNYPVVWKVIIPVSKIKYKIKIIPTHLS